jgi:hypothetical protein
VDSALGKSFTTRQILSLKKRRRRSRESSLRVIRENPASAQPGHRNNKRVVHYYLSGGSE